MPVTRGCVQLAEGRSGCDRTPEKRKVGGSIPPLTTTLGIISQPSHLRR